ncbi:hypothetical protein [Mesorhizobium sp. L-8-3]|uniref:hypothetical protein n=1 Tax=Mesorhizobium sp. L-8-3 TaxID=2744522 RepID=UPI0019278F49|nr:hypothetical protein [Mesorhizobium sp. L-8-3]BCH22085.1 hypothetical protein MesoLjLb_18700 [Mesorhizobium sp. L-8-3]
MANLLQRFLASLTGEEDATALNRLAAAGHPMPVGGLGSIGDMLFGGAGSDNLAGGPGADLLSPGNELFRGQAGTPSNRLMESLTLPKVTPGGGAPFMPTNPPLPTSRPDQWAGMREAAPQQDPMQTAAVNNAAPRASPMRTAYGDPYLAWQRGLGSSDDTPAQATQLRARQNGDFSPRRKAMAQRAAVYAGGAGSDIALGGNGGDTLQGEAAQGGGLGSLLGNLFGGGRADARNKTITWLMHQGLDQGTATVVASDPSMLRSYIGNRVNSGAPDWQFQTIYDDNGNEQKVLVDMNNPGSIQPVGGTKTNLKTPAELAQAKDIAAAGRSEIKLPTLENEYDKTLGKSYGERFTDFQKEAQTAQRALNSLTVMEQVMSKEGFYSGTAAEQVRRVKQFARALGFDPDGVDSMEAFNAMSKQTALDAMGGSLGTGFSNADRDFVIDQVPNLGNTPEGNRQLIQIQRKLAQRKQHIAKLAREYAAKNGGRIDPGFDDYLSQWAEQNPLFPSLPPNSTPNGPERVRNPQPGASRPRATNGTTILEFDGTQWVPVQ